MITWSTENEYAPLEPIVDDWVSLLDTDPAEAFRVRARLERLAFGCELKSFSQLWNEISESKRRIEDIWQEVEDLKSEESELQSRICHLEGIYYQRGRRLPNHEGAN